MPFPNRFSRHSTSRRFSRKRKQVARRQYPYRFQAFRNRVPANLRFGSAQFQIVKWKFGFDSGDDHAISSSTGAYVDYAYRATSPYDPYAETGGAQARGFDQWMALYNKGIVLGSKITATFYYSPTDVTATGVMCVGITRSMAITDPTADELAENRLQSRKVLSISNDKVTCVLKYSYRELCRDPIDAEELQFTSSGNTTKQVYYHVGGFALNAGTQVCHFIGDIRYTVLLMEPVNPPQS